MALLAIPSAVSLNSFAANNHEDPAAIKPLKMHASRWHIVFSAALFLVLLTAGVSVHGPESLA
jgi:hypothetical protein